MSYNHTIRLYRAGETRWHCGVKGCLQEATHVCSYEYTIGAEQRRATAHLNRCREDAQLWKKRYDAKYIGEHTDQVQA